MFCKILAKFHMYFSFVFLEWYQNIMIKGQPYLSSDHVKFWKKSTIWKTSCEYIGWDLWRMMWIWPLLLFTYNTQIYYLLNTDSKETPGGSLPLHFWGKYTAKDIVAQTGGSPECTFTKRGKKQNILKEFSRNILSLITKISIK